MAMARALDKACIFGGVAMTMGQPASSTRDDHVENKGQRSYTCAKHDSSGASLLIQITAFIHGVRLHM